MDSTQSSGQEKGKFELKEFVDRNQVQGVLRKWLQALEQDQDLEVTVNGQNCKIPKDAFMKAKIKLEYEIKEGEYEFELEMKWRNETSNIRQ